MVTGQVTPQPGTLESIWIEPSPEFQAESLVKKINVVMINQILINYRSYMSHESTLLNDNGYKALERDRDFCT